MYIFTVFPTSQPAKGPQAEYVSKIKRSDSLVQIHVWELQNFGQTTFHTTKCVVYKDKTTVSLRVQQCYPAFLPEQQRDPLSGQGAHDLLQPPPHHPELPNKLGKKLLTLCLCHKLHTSDGATGNSCGG